MRALLLIAVCWIASTVSAQDLRKEFVDMNDYLEGLSNFQMTVNYQTSGAEELEETGAVSVIVGENGMFYQLGGASIVLNNKQTILIDDEERSIIYSDNAKAKKNNSVLLTEHLLKGIDSLITRANDIEFYMDGKTRVYSIRMENAYFDLVQVHFEQKCIAKVQYFYNSNFVDYKGLQATCIVDIQENIEFDKNCLATDYYLSEKDGVKVPSEKFTNYLIIYNESLESFID